jgi:hypothetical protein
MGSLKFNEMTNSIFFFNFSFTLEVKEMFPSWYIKNIRFFHHFFLRVEYGKLYISMLDIWGWVC